MKSFLQTLALLGGLWLLPALADSDLDPLAGEWGVEGECSESRMVFDFEGAYDFRMAEDGRWKSLHSGQWSRDGEVVSMTGKDGRGERFKVEVESWERMVLASLDGEVDRELGVGYLDLTRCFAP